jgi:hypothetical protein
MGKIRCPLQAASMRRDRDRPEILTPPEHPQACCTQQTLTVPPDVNAKTRQKHDYPPAAHRRSYTRRTGAERGFATAKDPASNDISRGWCPLMSLAPLMLFTTTLLIVRNRGSCTPGTPGSNTTNAAPPTGCPPKPANGAARHSPASPPDRPDPGTVTTTAASQRPSSPPRDHHTPGASTPEDRSRAGDANYFRYCGELEPPLSTRQPECQTQT